MHERDRKFLVDMLRHAQEALRFVKGVTAEEYEADRKIQLAVQKLVEIVGEAAGNVSPRTQGTVDLDWRHIKALRNVLVHQYGRVVHTRVYGIVVGRFPPMVFALESALRDAGVDLAPPE